MTVKYLVGKRYKGDSLTTSSVNLPRDTELTRKGDMIYFKDIPICIWRSEIAKQYFVYNKDGKGRERFDYIHSIKDRLQMENKHQERWDKIWNDFKVCPKYKRSEKFMENYWLWNDDFYSASISDLKYIFNLIKDI